MSSKHKVVAGLITMIILGILVLSGPVNAYLVSIKIIHPAAYRGEIINFIISLNSEEQDTGVSYISLDLIGTPKPNINYTCKFDVDGVIISGCAGITISRIEGEFGYGYGYGKLEKGKYNISLDTTGYSSGKYKTVITSVQENMIDVKKGATINIKPRRSGIKDCSVRGSGGSLSVEEIDFGTKNKINFFIPLENAVNGEGYLTGQKGRERFSYNFKVEDILVNSTNEIKVLVSGEYQTGLNAKVKEESMIILIQSGEINIDGENIELDGMRVTYKKGC